MHSSAKQHSLSLVEYLPRHGAVPPLEVGDIVLIHTKKDIGRAIYRKVTKSYWNHTAMILYPKGSLGAEKNLYIEGVGGRMRIHTLNHLLNQPDRYDIGIKRFPDLPFEMQRRIIAFSLLSIDVKTPRHRFIGTKFILGLMFPFFKDWIFQRPHMSSTAFVQRVLYESADWEDRFRVSFKERLISPVETELLLTPKEIADSTRCEWIYNKRA